MPGPSKRWTEAIAQNILASIVFLVGGALVVYLLTDAGNRLTVRVWWLAIAVLLLLLLLVWLLWLTAQMLRLRARASAIEQAPARVSVESAPPPPHPHQGLLDRMDAMIEDLGKYERFDSVSWQTGQAYNDLMDESGAVDQRFRLDRLPVATAVQMAHGPPTSEPEARELAGGLRQARIHVAHAKD